MTVQVFDPQISVVLKKNAMAMVTPALSTRRNRSDRQRRRIILPANKMMPDEQQSPCA
jgi:hypothetical protein